MARKINCKIDVKKLDKSKLFVGKEGTYANITLIETPNGKYGNWMIVEDQTKEEREAKKKSTILGNGKNHGWDAHDSGDGQDRPATKTTISSDDIAF